MTSNQHVVEALSKLLADTYTLYLKTHNYHWSAEFGQLRRLL